jgi:hypothetical protein
MKKGVFRALEAGQLCSAHCDVAQHRSHRHVARAAACSRRRPSANTPKRKARRRRRAAPHLPSSSKQGISAIATALPFWSWNVARPDSSRDTQSAWPWAAAQMRQVLRRVVSSSNGLAPLIARYSATCACLRPRGRICKWLCSDCVWLRAGWSLERCRARGRVGHKGLGQAASVMKKACSAAAGHPCGPAVPRGRTSPWGRRAPQRRAPSPPHPAPPRGAGPHPCAHASVSAEWPFRLVWLMKAERRSGGRHITEASSSWTTTR